MVGISNSLKYDAWKIVCAGARNVYQSDQITKLRCKHHSYFIAEYTHYSSIETSFKETFEYMRRLNCSKNNGVFAKKKEKIF